MVNLRQMFVEESEKRKDVLCFAVVGWHDKDVGKWREPEKEFPVEPWLEAAQKIDYEYDSGFGGADCHAVIAWGEKFIYFIHEYDGATGIRCVPRLPQNYAPDYL